MRTNYTHTVLICLICLIFMLWMIDPGLVIVPIVLVYLFFSFAFSLTFGPLITAMVAACLFWGWMNAAAAHAVVECRNRKEATRWECEEAEKDSVGFIYAYFGFLIGCGGIFFSLICLWVR